MKITSGPNWQFYAVTAFFAYISVEKSSPWPLLGWVGFCIALIPLCIWLHKWNERQNRKMAEEFPLDPFIQAKYGRKP